MYNGRPKATDKIQVISKHITHLAKRRIYYMREFKLGQNKNIYSDKKVFLSKRKNMLPCYVRK